MEKYLSSSQKSMKTTLMALLEGPVKFAIEYELFYDEAIYQQFTRNYLAWVHPFPISFFLPIMERNEKIEELLAHHPVLNSQIIYSSVSHALSCISNYLQSLDDLESDTKSKVGNSSRFVFGSNPSILDAALYAYIHICVHLLSKCERSRLSKLMRGKERLLQFYSFLEVRMRKL
jgi:hypothetical protein